MDLSTLTRAHNLHLELLLDYYLTSLKTPPFGWCRLSTVGDVADKYESVRDGALGKYFDGFNGDTVITCWGPDAVNGIYFELGDRPNTGVTFNIGTGFPPSLHRKINELLNLLSSLDDDAD